MTNPLDYTIQDPDAMRYALMANDSAGMRKGGAVHMADGGWVQNAYRSIVPAQIRTFGETLMGDRTPITEQNFTESELNQMRQAIANSRTARQKENIDTYNKMKEQEFLTGKKSGILEPSTKFDQTVDYQHYGTDGKSVRSDLDITPNAAVRNTLGRFAYHKNPQGDLIATDYYKFKDDLPRETRPTAEYEGMSTPEKLWTLAKDSAHIGGLESLPSRTGSAFIGADGRPVNVNLGPAPFAAGGAVRGYEEGGPIWDDSGKMVLPAPFQYDMAGRVDGGNASQADIDRMKFELAQSQFPNSPVMEATPKPFLQNAIGTLGGYMDRAGNFIKDTLAPIAETNPRQHFLAEMFLVNPLKGAGTALQDYTGTVREADEDNPVRGIISKDWHNLTTSRSPILDPRVLDIAQFATPVVSEAAKLAGAGAKAVAPFATKVDDMVRELYAAGHIPQPGMSIKDVTPRALAPANEMGFYSPTEAAALNLQRKSGQGQAFLNDIMKGDNVRPDEINAMGLDTFLKGKTNVTADEVRDYIAQNKIQLGETRYGALTKDISESRDAFKAYGQELANKYGIPEGQNISMYAGLKNIPAEEIAKYERLQNEWLDQQPKAAKFSGYQLPGGENYREVVLTLPDKRAEAPAQMERPKVIDSGVDENGRGQFDVVVEGKPVERFNTWSEAQDHALELQQSENIKRNLEWENNKPDTYKSSHWDEPNVLAHLRMSDRVTDGKKTLLVDEVQSDWHQAGREQGYKSDFKPIDWNDPEYAQARRDSVNATNAFNSANENPALQATLRAEMDRAREVELSFANASNKRNQAIPDAPYKEDWYQLALKRAVKEAIDGGYDRVALPTGARVNERFDLSKQIDRIDYNKNPDGTYNMSAIKDGSEVFAKEDLDEKELSGIIGKDVAKKIVGDEGHSPTSKADRWEAEDGDVPEFKSLSGLDLQVGGEGNKKYYDEIYPNYLKKFGKKYGATVGKTNVVIDDKANGILADNGKFFVDSGDGINFKEFNTYAEATKYLGIGVEPLHYMDITPAMREAFKTGIHMKKGGRVTFTGDIDAMKYELAKAK